MSNNHERQRKFTAAELELFRKFSGTLNNEIEKSFKYDYQHYMIINIYKAIYKN